MRKRKFILGGFASLVFLVFVAINLTVSSNYQGDGSMAQFSLTQLEAKAQGGAEDCPLQEGHCLPTGCYVLSWRYYSGGGDPLNYYWQYNGCQSICNEGGGHCCYLLDSPC